MNYKHGHKRAGSVTPTYRSWCGMIRRADGKHEQASDYSERGIGVCDRWRVFENFLSDMGERPTGLTLERVDNDRGYEPGNCRWATRKEQNRNRRGRRIVEFRGERMLLAEAIERSGVPKALFEQRVYLRGWSVDRALNAPPRAYRRK